MEKRNNGQHAPCNALMLNRIIFPMVLLFSVGVLLVLICIFLAAEQIGKDNIRLRTFTESSRELHNPNRGFYRIYMYEITDKKVNYKKVIADQFQDDIQTDLSLIEVNLRNYREGAISEEGLDNIDALFEELESLEKGLIVRFLYDWDGEIEKYEPENLDIILMHMEQLEVILRRHRDQIFIVQGMFTGNWGEMNGTQYSRADHLRELTGKLMEVTDESTYLAVRMPSQWRRIMTDERLRGRELRRKDILSDPVARRLSLFNDSMLSDESDGGTYGTEEYGGAGVFRREEELAIQQTLCSVVPNGGEVLNDNPYNDLSEAIEDFSRMHVTYLNDGYDQAVLDKWARETFQGEGCFQGMDGLTYMERHLGYRLLITDTGILEDKLRNSLSVDIVLKNVGFAPVYRAPQVRLVLHEEKENRMFFYEMEGNLCELAGGNEAEKTLTLSADIALRELPKTKYSLYFSIVDPASGRHILLANQEDEKAFGEVYDTQYGYCIGTVELP